MRSLRLRSTGVSPVAAAQARRLCYGSSVATGAVLRLEEHRQMPVDLQQSLPRHGDFATFQAQQSGLFQLLEGGREFLADVDAELGPEIADIETARLQL